MQSGGVALSTKRAHCTKHPKTLVRMKRLFSTKIFTLFTVGLKHLAFPWKAAWPLNAAPTRYTVSSLKQVCATVNSSNESVKVSFENNPADALLLSEAAQLVTVKVPIDDGDQCPSDCHRLRDEDASKRCSVGGGNRPQDRVNCET